MKFHGKICADASPLWEKVDRRRAAAASRMRGLSPQKRTPHPALRATFSHKGKGNNAAAYAHVTV